MKKETKIYFGKKFYLQKNGYWANWMPIHAQRWVWICHHGMPPKGMDVHHKDGNKSNNEIENLELLNRSNHMKEHWKDPDLRKERRRFLDEIRPKVHVWLRSDEGRRVQSEASKRAWKTRKTFEINCLSCAKTFLSTQPWAKCCDYRCYSRYSRKLKKG